jgi:dTDP-glucose 4,6-dehydratase
MKRFLITGGAGFIGSNFIHYLFNKYEDITIVNLDKLTYAGNLENLKDIENMPNYKFVRGDICDFSLLDKLIPEIEVVVNFAAETHVDRSIMDADSFILTDVYGTYNLLKAVLKHGTKLFVHISTDEVYGAIPHGSATEDQPLNPRNPYSASKAGADKLVLSFHSTYEVPIIIIRPSNNFGPYQYPEKLISLFITNAIDDISLPLYGDGKQVREWLYVEDNCSAIDWIIRKGKVGEIYNIGSNYHLQNIDVVHKILHILQKPISLIRPVADRPGHDRRYSLDSSKISHLGWKPQENFDKALEKTVHWYKENEPWWRKIKEKDKNYREYYKRQYGSTINGIHEN